jgi:uncharacterized protein YecE (DUF72 family)
MTQRAVFIGTAGWSIRAEQADAFAAEGSQLQRYAAVMNCVEINSSFYRSHRPQTYARWAASTPEGFRFAVKLPKQISHEQRLLHSQALLARFVGEAGALGEKWAVLLVQLPPSLAFDAGVAGRFFEQLRSVFDGAVVCEPRHASWFTAQAEQLMCDHQVSRAAVDPAKWPGADAPGGWRGGVPYFRWHGSPRTYWSSYDEAWLAAQATRLRGLPAGEQPWCVFDNTAAGAALGNALQLRTLL